MSGRDVFLRQQALQAGAQRAQTEAASILRQREAEGRAEQRARMDQLVAQRQAAATIRQGGTAALAAAVTGATRDVAGAAMQVAGPVAADEFRALMGVQPTAELATSAGAPAPTTFGGIVL